MDTPSVPQWIVEVELWLGKLVAIGAGAFALWKGVRFTSHRLRGLWRELNRFAEAVESLRLMSDQLLLTQARQRIFLELHSAPVWRADRQGLCCEANAAFLRLAGRSLAEVSGNGWADLLDREEVDEVLAAWQASVSSGAQFTRKLRLWPSRDQSVLVRMRGLPVLGSTGAVTEYIVSVEAV